MFFNCIPSGNPCHSLIFSASVASRATPMRNSFGRLLYFCVLTSLLAYYAIDTERAISSHAPKIDAKSDWRGTYTPTGGQVHYRRPDLRLQNSPDITAVILNWSRLPNVIQLVGNMCNSLQDTLAQVFVWNNNPLPLTHEVGLVNRSRNHIID
jgi:hypothetical protein